MEEEVRKLRKPEPRMDTKKESRRRSENKRRSLIIAQDEAIETPQKKTNKDSQERKGHVYYAGDYSNPPVRSATPNGNPSMRSGTPLPISTYSSPRPSSPQVPVHETPTSRPGTPRTHSRHASKESNSRPRTRTLDESRFREKSPASSTSKHRHRGASLQAPTLTDSGQDSSIGFPSIEHSPPLELQMGAHRQKLSKSQSNRPLSPIRNPIAAKPGTPLTSTSTDAKKILQLMKTTCGRMHGILSFRTSTVSIWASGYCAINVASGSLIYQTKGEVSLAKTLVPDLRGCQVRTLYDAETRSTFLDVSSRRSTMGVHLRPHVPETFDSWLAALLCWQPIRPKGVQNKMRKPQEAAIAEKTLAKTGERSKRNSGSFPKDAAIIKVGKMLMYEKDARSGLVSPPPGHMRVSTFRPLKAASKHWRKVSCTLQENGHFKLFAEPESVLEAIVPLSALSRCAIQRLDPSILDDEFSLAIYPQYTSMASSLLPMQTIYLSMESRVLFEVWFVLLRAFTMPELYGPEAIPLDATSGALDVASVTPKSPCTDMFRVERLLSLRVIEAKFHSEPGISSLSSNSHSAAEGSKYNGVVGNYYAELQLDSEVRARTAVKKDTPTPFWREDFEFVDLPPFISTAVMEMKTRNPGQKDWTLAHAPLDLEKGNMNPQTIEGDIEVSPLDLTYGKVDLRLDDIERATDTEKWWPILDEQDEVVGELFMRVRIEELVVLMGRDYARISELLHSFPNGLTNQITQMAHGELKRLSEILLNIFQVSGHASAWLMSLVEDEIDSVHRETPMSKFRYGRRIASNDSFESGVEREMFLRDLGKNASVEANLLFRGNSLLTKALDLHMRRLGKEYLEETLSEKMRDIEESDPECEVDPHRVRNQEDLERNWRNLKALTENIWNSIASSAARCPPELRIIMRRVRDCAEDRYGDFHRSVAYSSVSGFLFLRFFTPAVLNPKLFGLLKDHPRPRAQRTLTLITKTLQTLANMTTFGAKEPWMEPMNVFLTTHRQEFKSFVDEICDISSDRATSAIPPSYATPITILSRLPGTSREGFPSLPYLIDQAKECASLVDVWLDAKYDIDGTVGWTEELKRFDELCEESRERAKQCLTRAEQAERPSGVLEPKWEELVEQMERKARLRENNGYNTPHTPTVGEGSSHTVNSSTSSLAEGYFHRSAILHPRDAGGAHYPSRGYNGPMATSPHSPLSPDEATSSEMDSETTNTPPGSSSGIWDPLQSPRMEDHPAPNSEIDELGIENSSDVLGSSIYNLAPVKSKRDSDATAKAIPISTPARSSYGSRSSHGSKSSQSSKGNKKGPRSSYGLRHSSEREDISKSVNKSKSVTPSSSRDGAPSERPVKSLYRLNAAGSSQQAGDSSASLGRRSPSSRDGKGGLSNSVFGGVFRKRVRERDKEREREEGYLSR